MKTFMAVILISISTSAFASGHEYWHTPQYPTINQQNYERKLREDYNVNRALQRELRETGKIAPKDYTDVYNMRQGYGHDGAPSYNYNYDYGY